MICVETYMQNAVPMLQEAFGSRLCYVGLQGSYLRGEATESSDIDVIVVVDGLSAADLSAYKQVIDAIGTVEKSCGFICGKEELKNWNVLEMCNFLHATKDYYGKIQDLIPTFTDADIIQFIKLSVGNLYHEITHRYIHADLEKNIRKLPYTYKGVFFILQSVYYLHTGVFYKTKAELMKHLSDQDRRVMQMGAWIANHADYDFEETFTILFDWCKDMINREEYRNVHL